MKSITDMLAIVLLLLAFSLRMSDAASSCYACSNCGTTWDVSKATIVSTSGANDYCRKLVTGTVVTKDYSSSCVAANILGNGVFCCQSDFCNAANPQSMAMINLGFVTMIAWTIYYYMY